VSVVGFGASDCAKFGAQVPARGFDFIGDQFTVEGYFNRQRSARLNFDMTVSGILLTTLTAFLLGSNLSTYNSAIFGCASSLVSSLLAEGSSLSSMCGGHCQIRQLLDCNGERECRGVSVDDSSNLLYSKLSLSRIFCELAIILRQ
jgi:hypothetical protein